MAPLSTLGRLQREALSRFSELGLPTTRDEEWRYTSVAPIAAIPFESAPETSIPPALRLAIDPFAGHLAAAAIVNGRLATLESLDEGGVHVTSLSSAASELLETHLDRIAPVQDRALTAMNTGMFDGGVLVRVDAGAAPRRTLALLFIASGEHAAFATHPRTLVIAEQGSTLSLAVAFVSVDGPTHLTNSVMEIDVRAGASVSLSALQSEGASALHIASFHAGVGAGARFEARLLSAGSALARDEIHVGLDGAGASTVLDGLYLATGTQHTDCVTSVDHSSPRGTSSQIWKGILDGRARGIFSGRVRVHRGAVGTDARQFSRALVLSDGAVSDGRPQLEILNDDVRCAHGSAIGSLDPAALFYLRSRGIGLEEARRTLTAAFGREIVERFPGGPIREAAGHALERWLARGEEAGP